MKRRSFAAPTSLLSVLLLVLLAYPVGLFSAGTAAAAPEVTVTPEPVGSSIFNGTLQGTNFDVSQVGYESSQYFLSGTASSYKPVSPLTSDGKWNVTTDASAPYTTRIAVYRPIDPRKFNGTVVVEWLNVSGGVDDSPDWTLSHNELVREGFAWVGVSAQAVGVNAAKATDPSEYNSPSLPLSHPGDSFSYDIFSQAGQAVRSDSAQILGGLTPHKLIAAGESQSAGRLMTYIDAVQPIAHVYNGFLVHSQFGTGAALSQAPQANVAAPTPTTIRSDLGVPVLEFETETDVFNSNLTDRTFFGNPRNFRLWEVAGSSHFDTYGLTIGPIDTGNGQGAVENLAAMQSPPFSPSPQLPNCNEPINTGGTHWVLDSAVHALNLWVTVGIAPRQPPYLATTQSSPVVFQDDANGNTIGGVRSPQVDAPVATLGGIGNSPAFCTLFGTTVPFTSSQLTSLYHGHAGFVLKWDLSTVKDLFAGYLVPADAVELMNSAASSHIG
jgi:Alpha/beta hydrolase domain